MVLTAMDGNAASSVAPEHGCAAALHVLLPLRVFSVHLYGIVLLALLLSERTASVCRPFGTRCDHRQSALLRKMLLACGALAPAL